MDQTTLDQAPWAKSQHSKTYPCPTIDSREAEYVAICMLAGSELQDVTFGLARRFPLPRHAPPHHIQWVSDIWTAIRRFKPPYYLEAEQTVGWLVAGALLRPGSWELGILVFNGWDVSAENLEALKRIKGEISGREFNAAGVNAYLGERLMMEGAHDGKRLSIPIKMAEGLVISGDEDDLVTEDGDYDWTRDMGNC